MGCVKLWADVGVGSGFLRNSGGGKSDSEIGVLLRCNSSYFRFFNPLDSPVFAFSSLLSSPFAPSFLPSFLPNHIHTYVYLYTHTYIHTYIDSYKHIPKFSFAAFGFYKILTTFPIFFFVVFLLQFERERERDLVDSPCADPTTSSLILTIRREKGRGRCRTLISSSISSSAILVIFSPVAIIAIALIFFYLIFCVFFFLSILFD